MKFWKRSTSILAIVCALATPALAADLALKARAVPTFSPNVSQTSGWFLTIGTSAGVAQSSVNGSNLFATSLIGGGLTADGAGVIAGVGYVSYGGPTGWWMATNDVTYQNISAGLADGAGSVRSNWMVTQEACVGAEIFSNLAALLPNIAGSFPTFSPVAPPGATGTPRQCFGAVSREYEISGRFGAATGQTWGWEPGLATHFIWQAINPTTQQPNGGAWDVSALVAFPIRGATFNNVFASNGAPITVGAGANLGTQYEVRLSYHFAPSGL